MSRKKSAVQRKRKRKQQRREEGATTAVTPETTSVPFDKLPEHETTRPLRQAQLLQMQQQQGNSHIQKLFHKNTSGEISKNSSSNVIQRQKLSQEEIKEEISQVYKKYQLVSKQLENLSPDSRRYEALLREQTRLDKELTRLNELINPVTVLPEVTVTPSVIKLPPGETPSDFIDRQFNELRTWEQVYWGRYERGITQFTNMMNFSSKQDAEAHYLDAVFKGTVKGFLDATIDILPPGLKQVAKVIKGGSDALLKENERVSNARGEVKIVEYINSLLSSLDNAELEKLSGLSELIPHFKNQYYSLNIDPEYDDREPNKLGIITGPCADFLNELKNGVSTFKNALPTSTFFQQQITERFAVTGELTTYVSQGGRPSGNLHLEMKVYKQGNDLSLVDLDGSWALATNAPKEDNLASSLAQALKAQGLSVYESNLQKHVHIWYIADSDWLNDHYHATIIFDKNPDDFEVRGDDSRNIRYAWQVFKKSVLGVNKVHGTDE